MERWRAQPEVWRSSETEREASRKVMPITVLRHRGRPRKEGARSFRSAAKWVKAGASGKTPTLKTARHCRQRTTRQLQRETATFQSILCGERPQIRKAGEPLQLDREDLRLVDQIQLKLQRGNLVRDGAVVRLRPGNVVVRVAVLDGSAAAAEVPVSQPLFGLP